MVLLQRHFQQEGRQVTERATLAVTALLQLFIGVHRQGNGDAPWAAEQRGGFRSGRGQGRPPGDGTMLTASPRGRQFPLLGPQIWDPQSWRRSLCSLGPVCSLHGVDPIDEQDMLTAFCCSSAAACPCLAGGQINGCDWHLVSLEGMLGSISRTSTGLPGSRCPHLSCLAFSVIPGLRLGLSEFVVAAGLASLRACELFIFCIVRVGCLAVSPGPCLVDRGGMKVSNATIGSATGVALSLSDVIGKEWS